jgi:cell division transport system permease protein
MSENRPKGFTVVVTLSLVMFLLGLLGVLIINASQLNDHIKSNLEITVFFQSELSDAAAKSLGDSILRLPFAASGTYISGEEAVFNFKNEIGEDFVDILGDNPLPASLEISLKREYTDESSLMQIDRELLSSDGVLEVSYPQNVFQQIDKNRRIISLWLICLSVLLVVIAVVLITNTIRIMTYADRFIIKNQQLIGASERFILKPYRKRALSWISLSFGIGVVLLIGFIWLIFTWLNVSMDLNMSAIGGHFTGNWYAYILMLSLLLIGGAVVILVATYFATKKYLLTHTDKLYT